MSCCQAGHVFKLCYLLSDTMHVCACQYLLTLWELMFYFLVKILQEWGPRPQNSGEKKMQAWSSRANFRLIAVQWDSFMGAVLCERNRSFLRQFLPKHLSNDFFLGRNIVSGVDILSRCRHIHPWQWSLQKIALGNTKPAMRGNLSTIEYWETPQAARLKCIHGKTAITHCCLLR